MMIKSIETRGSTYKEVMDYFERNNPSPVIIEVSSQRIARLGSISFPELTITFEGSRSDIEEVYNRFRIHFMRAGG